jgi:LDH2 family malate/lactate/ureidoglycolate dehydrogenase
VLNPDGWLGREAFLAHVEAFALGVHDLPPAEGFDQVLLPGEVEEHARAAAERDGVTLSATVAADLDALAAEVGLDRRLATAPD